MKHKTIILPIILLFIITGCSSVKEVSSGYSNNEVQIDGNYSEWKNLTTIDKEGIAFSFKNDDNNLYLMMLTNDRNKIMKIIRGGLEITLTPKNSDNAITIRYPDKPDMEKTFREISKQNVTSNGIGELEQGRSMEENMDNGMAKGLALQKEIFILNNDGFVVKSLPVNGKTVTAKISIDKGNFCYELKVPVNKNITGYEGLNADIKDKISVEFATGDLENDMMGMNGPNGQGGMPPGPPPGNGGNFPGGGNRPPGGDRRGGPQGNMNKPDFTPLNYSFDVITTFK